MGGASIALAWIFLVVLRTKIARISTNLPFIVSIFRTAFQREKSKKKFFFITFILSNIRITEDNRCFSLDSKRKATARKITTQRNCGCTNPKATLVCWFWEDKRESFSFFYRHLQWPSHAFETFLYWLRTVNNAAFDLYTHFAFDPPQTPPLLNHH